MRSYHFDVAIYQPILLALLSELVAVADWDHKTLRSILKKYPKPDGSVFAKDELVKAYRELAGSHGLPAFDLAMVKKFQMKPVRTISGVTPITVLTKPFPCPGTCIFCPNDIRMPKSYLSDEPGAQRAERNWFDPYLQTYNRLQALAAIGHNVDKAELIVLGGTWSFYPEPYQIWFITECFRALNDFGDGVDDRPAILARYAKMQAELSAKALPAFTNQPHLNQVMAQASQPQGEDLHKSYNQVVSELYVAPERLSGFDAYQTSSWAELEKQQVRNETAAIRNVGLVIETRPDNISVAEVRRIRRLGCTKAQIGVQSLQDEVLKINRRGHDVAATRRAFALLRQAGFKIHAHWMANLYGSSVAADQAEYRLLFDDPDFKPDELKIYPCSLIESAELMQYYQRGDWRPYTHDELMAVVVECLRATPEYCRLTRIVRDIPSTDIVVGNKFTNFRQLAEAELARQGGQSRDIRAREVRDQEFDRDAITYRLVEYHTAVSREQFWQAESAGKLVGFVRLSLPTVPNPLPELADTAMVRELHVYGQVVGLGQKSAKRAQHGGVGSQLLQLAKDQASQAGFQRLAVISAIGTREYYRQRGFHDDGLYLYADITSHVAAQ